VNAAVEPAALAARAAPRVNWRHEALWCLLIAPLVFAPLLLGAPRALLLLGTGLAFWRAWRIGRGALRARQHEVASPLDAARSWALLASLTIVLAPHTLRLPLWLSALVALLVLWRMASIRRRLPAPPRALLLTLVALTSLGVFLQYGTLFGRDAGVALLSIMIALKLLELKSARDAIILVFLAYFLVITNFLYSQTLQTAILMLFAVWLITTTMIGLQQRVMQWRESAVHASQLLLQAVPLMIVLFVFFPRVSGPLWALPRDANRGITGLSDSMSPGSLSQLSASGEVAFRVEFAGAPPALALLYWRGPVLWQFDGRNWTTGGTRFSGGEQQVRPLSEPIAYTVTLEPHFERWLLALDMPSAVPPNARITSDLVLLANLPVRERVRYEGRAALRYRAAENEIEAELARGLQLPAGANPRTVALAQSLRAKAKSDRALVDSVLTLFREQPFYYTTSPPLLGSEHPVDQFLFDARRGFCEHYASSFTVLMRAAGVPSRVVTGYQGGVLNPVANYLVVRQAEAHAWSEVWLPGEGWVRVDPTAAVSPSRVESGIAASISDSDPLPLLVRGSVPLLSSAGFALDAVTNAWNQWVLAYNVQRQQQLLRNLGLDASDWRTLSIVLLSAAAAVTLAVGLLALRGLHRDPRGRALRAWDHACRKLERAGIVRAPSEGPSAFARRAAALRPDLAPALNEIAALYVALRYAPPPTGESDAPTLHRLEHRVGSLKT
jgi:protein-glutamine gamma-glutamyltransferase